MINAPLKKNELRSGERVVRVDAEGKASLTEFSVCTVYKDCTLIEAKPITGRTHQIRVHALHAGHPLIGDTKYNSDEQNALFKAKGLGRLMLHAHALNFRWKDSDVALEVPWDTATQQALQGLNGC